MTKKVLFVATVHRHFKAFHIPYIKLLQSKGYEVHLAANDNDVVIEEADKQFVVPISRNPISPQNIKAIKVLKNIIGKEQYILVHCNTPIGALVTRLAAKSFRAKKLLQVIYTAHGFYFYKGSPKKYWLIYYPIEKYFSKYVDAIITINTEDYNLIKERNFKNKYRFLIPGVGVKPKKFNEVTKETQLELRHKNKLKEDDFVLIYAAEYIYRKNHTFLINAVPMLLKEIPNLKLLLAGRGLLFDDVKKQIADLNLSESVLQLGFRKDIDELYKLSDIGISVSRFEGLGLNLIEAMMCGKPTIATQDKGHSEVIDHGVNGYLFEQENKKDFIKYILELYADENRLVEMGKQAKVKSKKFELNNSLKEMEKIYKQFLDF
jgi:glycosyltransferase EpsD